LRTDASTVESFPPYAPIAIRSPGEKSLEEVIVWWISSSKMEMKQGLQSFWWFFGRIIKARASLQMAQGAGAISRKGILCLRVWAEYFNFCWSHQNILSLLSEQTP
jgi:hypothetical protein